MTTETVYRRKTYTPPRRNIRYDLDMPRLPQLIIDPEIRDVVPAPETIREGDLPRVEPLPRSYDPRESYLDELREYLARWDVTPTITVWKNQNTIVDGHLTYKICYELGREFTVVERAFDSKEEAIRYRIESKLTAGEKVNDFVRAEVVIKAFDAGYYDALKEQAKANRKGRGKKISAEKSINLREVKARLAQVTEHVIKDTDFILQYEKKPVNERMMPPELVEMYLRRLRNGSRPNISGVYKSMKSFEKREKRKRKGQEARTLPTPREAESLPKHFESGAANYVIWGDCLEKLGKFEPESVDRFVFSPPYYGVSIDYGGGFSPFVSWESYQQWTAALLCKMWRILPRGGVIAVNIDNVREFIEKEVKSRDGNPKTKRTPTGTIWYHTELYRRIMHNIEEFYNYAQGESEFYAFEPERMPIALNEDFKLSEIQGQNADFVTWRDFTYSDTHAFDLGEFIWNKQNVVGKSEAKGSQAHPRRRLNHEYVMFFVKGRERTALSLTEDVDESNWSLSVWNIAPAHNKGHAAPFPKELARRMILLGGDVEDTICDPFAGTGTTLEVAAEHGLNYIGIELNGGNALRAIEAGKRGEETRRNRDAHYAAQQA